MFWYRKRHNWFQRALIQRKWSTDVGSTHCDPGSLRFKFHKYKVGLIEIEALKGSIEGYRALIKEGVTRIIKIDQKRPQQHV